MDKSASGVIKAYILQVNSNAGTGPIHLLVSETDDAAGQCFLPIIPAKISESGTAENRTIPQYVIGREQQILSTDTVNTSKAISKDNQKSKIIPQQPEKSTDNKVVDVIGDRNVSVIRSQICVHVPDRVAAPRAIAVLPEVLQIRGTNVSPRRVLPPRVRFGPVQGKMSKVFPAEGEELVYTASVNETPVFLLRKDEESVTHCDVSDKDKSNWLCLLPLGTQSSANVWLYEEDNELYGVTVKPIPCRTALAIGYSKKYAEEHRLPHGNPVLDLDEVLVEDPKQWWCFECRQAFFSATLLQRHLNVYHKEKKPPPRKQYRCPHCSLTFSRLFSYKRHVVRFCTKRNDKSNINNAEKPTPANEKETNSSLNHDESRTPSDESFQIYSQGLDFSTNLFDTDRMPNLDISGSSKSDLDFNAYDGSKDGPPVDEEISCVHCKQSIMKSKRCKHLRECPARRFQCECDKIFTDKEKFAQHVFNHHVKEQNLKSPAQCIQNEAPVRRTLKQKPSQARKASTTVKEKSSKEDSSKDTPYKCNRCERSFKRRGMLVNHLWRAHDTYTAVPLERRVKHYPCPACPKTYSTAAKQRLHIKNYHPDAKSIRAVTILGERRKYEPAVCTICPRQYSTNAKLLQHIRAQHPLAAKPVKTL